jgi:hypothetical protein
MTKTEPQFSGAFRAVLDGVAGTAEGLLSWVTGRRRTGNAVFELAGWVLGNPAGRKKNRR